MCKIKYILGTSINKVKIKDNAFQYLKLIICNQITDSVFLYLSNLIELIIDYCKNISNIGFQKLLTHEYGFQNLTKLKKLNITDDAFYNLFNLEELNIEFDSENFITYNAFKNLTKLEDLNF